MDDSFQVMARVNTLTLCPAHDCDEEKTISYPLTPQGARYGE